MHILTTSKPIHVYGDVSLEADTEYLVEDINGAELIVRGEPGAVALRRFGVIDGFDPARDWNDSSVLIVRPGGYGDLLFLTAVLREMIRRWPSIEVSVSCLPHFAAIFEGLPYPHKVLPYPIAHDVAAEFDHVVFLENVVEGNPAARSLHIVDVMAARLGLNIRRDEDKRCEYRLTEEERAWAEASFPKLPHVRRLGIQVGAGAVNRSMPRESLGKILQEMLSKGWEIFLFDAPRQPLGGMPPGVTDFAGLGFPFRKSVAVMSQCDVVLGPDSALVHIAGALNLPCVAMYGPFPAKLRTAYAPSITAIQGGGHCAPCFHHARGGMHFPQDKPCTKSRRCEVLAAIDPAKVVKAIEKAWRR